MNLINFIDDGTFEMFLLKSSSCTAEHDLKWGIDLSDSEVEFDEEEKLEVDFSKKRNKLGFLNNFKPLWNYWIMIKQVCIFTWYKIK